MASPERAGRRTYWNVARHVVQACALVLFFVPLLAAGWSLLGMTPGFEEQAATPAGLPLYGSFASSSVLGLDLLDPLAFLQVTAAAKTIVLPALLAALPVLMVYALVRGRAFCGWVCPLGTVLELVDKAGRALRTPAKERVLPRHAKLWTALGVIALSAATCVPVFEAVNPINAVHRALLFGSTAGVWTFALVVALELFWGRRVWCRALCPLGGLYEAAGRVGLANVRIDHEACVQCDRCKAACLADPEILEPALAGKERFVSAGDCMACGACVDACPTRALSLKAGFDHYRKNE